MNKSQCAKKKKAAGGGSGIHKEERQDGSGYHSSLTTQWHKHSFGHGSPTAGETGCPSMWSHPRVSPSFSSSLPSSLRIHSCPCSQAPQISQKQRTWNKPRKYVRSHQRHSSGHLIAATLLSHLPSPYSWHSLQYS